MNLIALEKLQELEDIRLETMASRAFQEWSNSLNVSRLHTNREPLLRAHLLNKQYDYSLKNKVASLMKRLYL
jgi:hypothetical protein